MAEFHKLLARLKGALEVPTIPGPHPNGAPSPLPVTAISQRSELASSFARELEAVGGHFIGNLSAADAAEKVAAIAKDNGARTAAVGEGVTTRMSVFSKSLGRAGCTVLKPGQDSTDRATWIDRLALTDIGVAEADYAIASTGTFAVMSAPARPNSLTLLPPLSVIVANVERLVADLAAAIVGLGPEELTSHRLSLITGPSRTADIEKRIVLGVHGPKHLYGALIWPDHE